MNILEKLKLLKVADKAMEVIPVNKLWLAIDGKKTYLAVLGWGVFKFGVASGWWPANEKAETFLLTVAGLSARDAISKASGS